MDNKPDIPMRQTSLLNQLIFYIIAILLFAGYIAFYQYAPFEGVWNDVVLNVITVLSASFAAAMSTAIFFSYLPDDLPRFIWKNIMIACWLWVLGEAIWGVYNVTVGEVPTPSIADAGWVGGFVFFTIAFYHQYILIMPSRKVGIRNIAILSWVVALLIPLIALSMTRSLTPETYINYYYPFADLAVGVAGLILVFVFRGGALMRPWVGLVIFGGSDLLYAWAQNTGVYSWSVAKGNSLTLFIDCSYIAAYLVLALGFVGHWTLLKYGLSPRTKRA